MVGSSYEDYFGSTYDEDADEDWVLREDNGNDDDDDDDEEYGHGYDLEHERDVLAENGLDWLAIGRIALEGQYRLNRWLPHPALRGNHFMSADIQNLALDRFRGMYADDTAIADGTITALFDALEEDTPRQPSRPRQPLSPPKLTPAQEKLASNPEYTRTVPPINSGDPAVQDNVDHSQQQNAMVCAECANMLTTLVAPLWASRCGHVICNSCFEAIRSKTKKCPSCGSRVYKKGFVRLYS
ncbi:hypothetical protein EV182_004643 [Spiromyces aspiralis]|uniref:Uncharacterized protein n=1 Tax=Spiromyces aspiralis TaxID=68401 RepID=A0ACC1HBP5_9FUNG|nr:hypothetical protein EV182_004643 [Spiromyces aspiralis]